MKYKGVSNEKIDGIIYDIMIGTIKNEIIANTVVDRNVGTVFRWRKTE